MLHSGIRWYSAYITPPPTSTSTSIFFVVAMYIYYILIFYSVAAWTLCTSLSSSSSLNKNATIFDFVISKRTLNSLKLLLYIIIINIHLKWNNYKNVKWKSLYRLNSGTTYQIFLIFFSKRKSISRRRFIWKKILGKSTYNILIAILVNRACLLICIIIFCQYTVYTLHTYNNIYK